jgi:hypothetical protein
MIHMEDFGPVLARVANALSQGADDAGQARLRREERIEDGWFGYRLL